MYCICCGKNNVRPVPIDGKSTEQDIIWGNDEGLTINNEMVYGGIIHIIDAGYGSKYDGDRIILAICDDCIKQKLEDHTLLYFDNYMHSDNPTTKEEIENSKKGYNRRKNLDDLL